MMSNQFEQFFEDPVRKKKSKYNSFKTAIEQYNAWIRYTDNKKDDSKNLYDADEIIRKIGCYTLTISLLEDRCRVYFWWAAFSGNKGSKPMIETKYDSSVLRFADEKEFLEYSIEPTKDKSYYVISSGRSTMTPLMKIINKLKINGFFDNASDGSQSFYESLADSFNQRNEIIHNAYIKHNKISQKKVVRLFKQFRKIDKLLKEFQRNNKPKKTGK